MCQVWCSEWYDKWVSDNIQLNLPTFIVLQIRERDGDEDAKMGEKKHEIAAYSIFNLKSDLIELIAKTSPQHKMHIAI